VRLNQQLVQAVGYTYSGVCSMYLRVDRSINGIHKPRALYPIEVVHKKYSRYLLVIDIFYVNIFSIKLVESFKNVYL
jgi:hypothetical protein